MSNIECKIIDPILLSGSQDFFRTAIGGYWDVVSSSTGEELVFTETGHGLEPFNNITSTPSSYIDNVKLGRITPIDEDVIVPNYKAALKISSTEDVESDVQWKALFLGGTVGDEEYVGIYKDQTFDYQYLTSSKPYPKIEAAKISSQDVSEIQISYEYNNYLSRYQNYISQLGSVLEIPNYYVIADLQNSPMALTGESNLYDSQLISSVTRHGESEGTHALFKLNSLALGQVGLTSAELSGDTLKKINQSYTYLATNYLSDVFVNTTLSSSVNDYLNLKLQNVIIDTPAFERLYGPRLVASEFTRKKYPFYAKISFPFDTPSTTGHVSAINDANYSTRFLKTLKEAFSGEIPSDLMKPVDRNLSLQRSYISGSELTLTDTDVVETEDVSYRTLDYVDMLTYMRNNYETRSNNCLVLGEKDVYRNSVNSASASYRYINSLGSISVLNNLLEFLNTTSNYNSDYPLDMVYNDNVGYTETIAYRVAKTGGTASGDLRTQKILQNYWFMNTSTLDEMDLIDSQVKYGEDYTYTVYAYVMTVGTKYQFSDLALSKQLCTLSDSEDYGLELYDPSTGDIVDTLFPMSALAGDLASEAQISSESPRVAEFYLNYEPSVKLIEIPLYTKTITVMDNPSNSTNIYPYQQIDASQKIGFNLYYESFLKKTIPSSITSQDSEMLEKYRISNDLLSNSKIENESVSRPRYVEIYRILTMPTKYSDFDNNLVTTLDLLEPNAQQVNSSTIIAPPRTQTYTNIFYNEKIRVNQKYYYLFRILNEQRSLSHLSEIYEAQLVDDGGFNYSLFNVFYESDLEENTFVEPSKNFTKLIHLKPNVQHLFLDTSEVDYNVGAYSQLTNVVVGDAEDLIWGKTFKVRLTSKKTGKKIDLNITYKLNSEI